MNALVEAEEQARVARGVCSLLNTCEYLPVNKVDFEYIGDTGMSLVTVQAAHTISRYITGGYLAQYQFSIVYRLFAQNNDERLQADEVLDAVGAWLEKQQLQIDYMSQMTLRRDTRSAMSARYENGAEDHEINFTLTYEVN